MPPMTDSLVSADAPYHMALWDKGADCCYADCH